jgi:transketolase
MNMEPGCADLAARALEIRRDIVTMIHAAGDGHPGPSLSIVELVTALYFSIMRIDPARPQWPDRDRFVLSKGHACPALYAALARRGFFPAAALNSLRSLGSILQGHPDMRKTPGVDSSSGSLGNGIAIGLGMALAARITGRDYFVYVVAGDGELQEGVVWEAAMAAAHHRAGRLIVFVDQNGFQSGGTVAAINALAPLAPRWQAFGWHCLEIDGHDLQAICRAVTAAQAETGRPSCIVAHTVKGKGVAFMEGDNSWHKRTPTAAELARALALLAEEGAS